MSKIKHTYYQDIWLKDARFVSWLSHSKSKENAFCRLCKKDFGLSNMGERALTSHANGKKHKTMVSDQEKLRIFFQPKPVSSTKEKSTKSDLQIIEPTNETEKGNLPEAPKDSSSKSSIDSCFQDSLVQNAEIRWALKQVFNGHSDNSCKKNVNLFQIMFPDSEIAKKMRLEPNKLKYMINHGIAPYVKKILEDDVKKSEQLCGFF